LSHSQPPNNLETPIGSPSEKPYPTQAGLKLREPIQEKNVVVVTKLLERKIQAQLVYQVKEIYNRPEVESKPRSEKNFLPKGWLDKSQQGKSNEDTNPKGRGRQPRDR